MMRPMTTPRDLHQLATTYGAVDRVTWGQVQEYSQQFWDVLAALAPDQRREFRARLLDGRFPPALLASAADEGQDDADVAALSLWTRYQPESSSELAAWVAIMVAVLTHLDKEAAPAPAPPPATVIVIELPEENRPTDELPPAGPPVSSAE